MPSDLLPDSSSPSLPLVDWTAHVREQARLQALAQAALAAKNKVNTKEQTRLRNDILQAVLSNDVDKTALLLEQGANVDTTNARDRALLLTAVENKNIPMVALLLENGAKWALSSLISELVYADQPLMAEALEKVGFSTSALVAGQKETLDTAIETAVTCPRLRSWWLQRRINDAGSVSRPSPAWPLNPQDLLSAFQEQWSALIFPNKGRYHSDPSAVDQWSSWIDDAVIGKDASLLSNLAHHVLGIDPQNPTLADPDRQNLFHLWVARAWTTAIVFKNDPKSLAWLVEQSWTPPSVVTPKGIAWGWMALERGSSECFEWLETVPGMAAQMRADAVERPSQTLLREASPTNATKPMVEGDYGNYRFNGWTTGQLSRLHRLGVDVGVQDKHGTLFHRRMNWFNANTNKDSLVWHDRALKWLVHHRPDLLSVPSPAGQSVLERGDALYRDRDFYENGVVSLKARNEWLVMREALEKVALNVAMKEALPNGSAKLDVAKPRARL